MSVLDTKIATFIADLVKVHLIVHGDNTVVVSTDGGPIPSFAKIINDNLGTFTLTATNAANDASAAVVAAELARDAALSHAQDAADSLTAVDLASQAAVDAASAANTSKLAAVAAAGSATDAYNDTIVARDAAAGSANAASGFADAAGTAATTANTKATAANTSAVAANTSAVAANTSKLAAATSETNAAASALAAATSEANAGTAGAAAGATAGANAVPAAIPTAIHAATAKATPVDGDEFSLMDSAAAYALKKVTWANIKATLKAYFDPIYAPISVPNTWAVAISDETTALTASNGKATYHAPYTMSVSEVMVGVTTPQASGAIFTVDVRKNGVSIFTTKPTVDNTESTTLTAATPAALTTGANPITFTKGDAIVIDITQIGDGTAKGCKVYFNGTRG